MVRVFAFLSCLLADRQSRISCPQASPAPKSCLSQSNSNHHASPRQNAHIYEEHTRNIGSVLLIHHLQILKHLHRGWPQQSRAKNALSNLLHFQCGPQIAFFGSMYRAPAISQTDPVMMSRHVQVGQHMASIFENKAIRSVSRHFSKLGFLAPNRSYVLIRGVNHVKTLDGDRFSTRI